MGTGTDPAQTRTGENPISTRKKKNTQLGPNKRSGHGNGQSYEEDFIGASSTWWRLDGGEIGKDSLDLGGDKVGSTRVKSGRRNKSTRMEKRDRMCMVLSDSQKV